MATDFFRDLQPSPTTTQPAIAWSTNSASKHAAGGPGLIATLTAAPLVMTLFYSAEFSPAVDLARWICLGMMLRIVAWPMGFIILAKGASRMFFWAEVAATVVHVGLAAILVPVVGATGAGIAFCGLYVCHTALVYWLTRSSAGSVGRRSTATSLLAFS